MLTLVLTKSSEVNSVGWDIKIRSKHREVWAFESMTQEEEQRYSSIYSNKSRRDDVTLILPSEENQPTIPKFAKGLADIADKVIVHKGIQKVDKRNEGGNNGTKVP